MEMDFWRQLGILVPSKDLDFPVTVIGCGGIGSPTALALAKMGCPDLTICDDDLVEVHNLPNQLHKMSHIGKAKVEGFADVVEEFTGVKPKIVKERVGANHPFERQRKALRQG